MDDRRIAFSVTLSVYLGSGEEAEKKLERIQTLAAQAKLSRNEWIRQAIEEKLHVKK